MSTDEPHSQLYFTDARDHWWNDDYIALVAKRVGLDRARRVLDVGSGQGHFARLWASHLAPDFEIVCVEPEARSIAVAEEKGRAFLSRKGLAGRFTYVQGNAESLPFANDGFDAAMCQTLLIHLREPMLAVREMTRVVRAGGIVLAAEPNNLASAQRIAATGPDADPEAMLGVVRMHAYCIRGKHRLGLGWNNLGVQLPRYFAELRDVRYFANDRPWLLAPPYASEVERAEIADVRSLAARGIWGWAREEARRYYVAGGGDEASFDREYDRALESQVDELRAIDAERSWELSAVALFIAAGVKG
jgi:SAM-dependent methyltransferase